ncbi:MAG: phosphoenolpyruvate hydrolase family protein, partial [Alphaproteobacteria bacterium]
MAGISRAEILDGLQAKVASRQAIIGAGAGTGLSAKCEEQGGADLIVIYNSGRYRMAGRGSLSGYLAYGNANDIVMDMAREVLPVVKTTPVLAGVNGTDPFLIVDRFLDDLMAIGFSGVQNFPTVGIIDGNFRRGLEDTGMSFDMEIDLIARANHKGLLTTPYVFSRDEALQMTEAGTDVLVAHFGLTAGGSIGASDTYSLDQCVEMFNDWADAVRTVKPDMIFICHGGPLAEPADVQYLLSRCPACHGFYGASSMERLPTEKAITERT